MRRRRLRVELHVGSALAVDELTDALAARRTPLLSSALPRCRCSYDGRVRVRVELGGKHDAPPCFVGHIREGDNGRGELVGHVHESRLRLVGRGVYLLFAALAAAAAVFGVAVSFPDNPALWLGAPAAVAFLRLARADSAGAAHRFGREAQRIEAAVRDYVREAAHPPRRRARR